MTEKQKKILDVALEFFANEGYNATSTNQIAKRAGVSEALIFRHFQNKRGVLEALLGEIEKKIQEAGTHLLSESNPKATIKKAINWIFDIDEKDYDYWRLQYKLKWDISFYRPEEMKPLLEKVAWAFEVLGYESPQLEAQLLSQSLDSIMISMLRDGRSSQLPLKMFLLKKYKLD